MTRALAAAAALAAAWAFWRWGGAAAAMLGLGAFDPLARTALALLALSLIETALSRLASRRPPADDHP